MKDNLTIEEVDRRVEEVKRSVDDKEIAHSMCDELLWRYINHWAERGCRKAKKIKHLADLELVKGWWYS